MDNQTMTKDERIRRAALLCCHLTRNLAYFKAGWCELQPKHEGDFWITVLGNSIDICVLEWSKLFGDDKGKHHWKRVVDDEVLFRTRLLSTVGITEEQWKYSWEEIKEYRDKFIAHLDSASIMHVPHMDIPHRMVCFLYEELKSIASSGTVLTGLPVSMPEYYLFCYDEGMSVFREIKHSYRAK
jgi:hypothetical protein